MKKFTMTLMAIFIGFAVLSQHLEAQIFMQNTTMGPQTGYGIYLKNDKGLGLGWVQQTNQWFESESLSNKHSFIGIGTLIPIQDCGKLSLMLTPKIGLVNGQFLAILPEASTTYQLFRNVRLGLGAGIRARKSAVSFSVSYQPF